jgi:hypothetical protein
MADGLIAGGYLGPHDDKAAWRGRYVQGAAQYRDWKARRGR